MRNLTLHELLEAFTAEAGLTLDRSLADGDEIPFEVIAGEAHGKARARSSARAHSPLYCYRPLTDAFVRGHLGALLELPSCAPAVQALEGAAGLESYLRAGGDPGQEDDDPARLAIAVLTRFLLRVFHDRDEFMFDDARFTAAYDELERALYRERCVTEVAARLRGIDLDPGTRELKLGEGLAICRVTALAGAPAELLNEAQAPLLLVLRVAHDRARQPPAAFARARFSVALTALRLFDRGEPAIDAVGYMRLDAGAWAPARLGFGGRSRRLMLVPREGEQELHDFYALIARRLPRPGDAAGVESSAGELLWALARFEMGFDRPAPLQGLSDHLLALRALLEPEGTASGRLAQRLSVICAAPEGRAALAARTARAIALERSVITGLGRATEEAELLAGEVAENLRAILRDMLCGHLDVDIRAVADELLAEAVAEQPLAA